jgi:transposase-like protein
MKGTIFEDSATSLRLWFHAIFLMSQTRCGISAKQIERELGVTYKTAWRMANRIRTLLNQDDTILGGTVEADESWVGGSLRNRHGRGRPKTEELHKVPVFGMAQRARDGRPGRVVAKMVPDTKSRSLLPEVRERVLPASTIYTDEWRSYRALWGMGYEHSRVNHQQGVYVDGDVHTNTIEGFWSLLKRGIGGVYHSVSTKHLQSYLDEYAFRYNHREDNMFSAFMGRIEKA